MVGSELGKIAAISSEYPEKETAVQVKLTGAHVSDNIVQFEYQVSDLLSNTNVNAVLVKKIAVHRSKQDRTTAGCSLMIIS